MDFMNGTISAANNLTYTPSLSNFPIPLRSLWTLIVTFPAIWDWTRLFLLGGLLETARRSNWSIWKRVVDCFLLEVSFDHSDSSYDWMMVWLSNQPAWSRSRTLEVSTFRPGQDGVADYLPGEDPEMTDKRKYLRYLPTPEQDMYVNFKYTWIRARRVQEQGDGYYNRHNKTEKLQLSILSSDRSVLSSLLLEAKRQFKAEIEGRVNIYVADTHDWELAGSRPKRPLSSVVLDKKVKDRILHDARDFMASEKWYAERGIPWRRGYLLYGAPGCGKTSLIHALAGELDLEVYIISLSKVGLDDGDLQRLISRLPAKSMALIEDIDAAFTRGISRDKPSRSASPSQHDEESDNKDKSKEPPLFGVTLSGLLNAIDGVAAQEGRLLFATTNKYHALDAALVRPGRLDVHIEFKLAERPQIEELFRCFYPSTISVDQKPLINLDNGSDSSEDFQKLSSSDVDHLSKTFASLIPENEFSMAAIQGHLMRYKSDPRGAIDEVGVWIEDEREQRRQRERRTTESQRGRIDKIENQEKEEP